MLEKSGHFGSNNANTLDGMIFLRYIAPQDQQRFTVPHSIDCVLRTCGLMGCFKCSNDFRGRCSIHLFVNYLRAVEPLPHVLFLYELHRIQSWATEWITKVSHKPASQVGWVWCHSVMSWALDMCKLWAFAAKDFLTESSQTNAPARSLHVDMKDIGYESGSKMAYSCSFFLLDPTSLSLLPSHCYNSDYQTSPKSSDELNWIMH